MPYKNPEDKRRHDKQYYKNHFEEISKKKKQNYLDNRKVILYRAIKWQKENREYRKKYLRNYYDINKEKIISNNKLWRKNNPEKRKAFDKKWRKTDKGKANSIRGVTKRRARNKNIINTLTAEEWIYILKKYKFRCAYCGKDFTLFDKETHDHIIPISKGGHNIKENVVPACRSCNSKKHDKLIKPIPFLNFFIFIF